MGSEVSALLQKRFVVPIRISSFTPARSSTLLYHNESSDRSVVDGLFGDPVVVAGGSWKSKELNVAQKSEPLQLRGHDSLTLTVTHPTPKSRSKQDILLYMNVIMIICLIEWIRNKTSKSKMNDCVHHSWTFIVGFYLPLHKAFSNFMRLSY